MAGKLFQFIDYLKEKALFIPRQLGYMIKSMQKEILNHNFFKTDYVRPWHCWKPKKKRKYRAY